jgi:hypothetical protein
MPPHRVEVDPLEQPVQMLGGQLHDRRRARPLETILLQTFAQQPETVAIPQQQLDPIAESNDIPHTDRNLLLLNIGGTHCMGSGCHCIDARAVASARLFTWRRQQACRVNCRRGCVMPRFAEQWRWEHHNFQSRR